MRRSAGEFFVSQPRNWDEPLSDFVHHIAGQFDPFHQVEAWPGVLGESDSQNHTDGVENELAEGDCHDSDAECSDSDEDLERANNETVESSSEEIPELPPPESFLFSQELSDALHASLRSVGDEPFLQARKSQTVHCMPPLLTDGKFLVIFTVEFVKVIGGTALSPTPFSIKRASTHLKMSPSRKVPSLLHAGLGGGPIHIQKLGDVFFTFFSTHMSDHFE